MFWNGGNSLWPKKKKKKDAEIVFKVPVRLPKP